MRDIDTIAAEFKPMGYKVSSTNLPKFGSWLFKWFSADAKQMYPLVDKEFSFDTTKLREMLGIEPIDLNTTIIDTCYDLIEHGVVPKTANYKSQSSTGAEPASSEQPAVGKDDEPANKAATEQENPLESEQAESKPAETKIEETPKEDEEEINKEPASMQDEQAVAKSAETKVEEPPKKDEKEVPASKEDEPAKAKSAEEETQEETHEEPSSKQDEPAEAKSAEEEKQEEIHEEPATMQDEQEDKKRSSPEAPADDNN